MSLNPEPAPTSEALAQARAHFEAGIAHFEHDRWPDAAAAFEAALALAPGRPSVLLNLGLTYLRQAKWPQALPVLRQAVQADDQRSDAWAALAWVQHETGDWVEAVQAGERALALGLPPSIDFLMRHAQCLSRLDRWQQAFDAYRQVLALAPDLHEALTELGHLHRQRGETAQARQCYQQARDAGADAELHAYYIAALDGNAQAAPQPPAAYVQGLFDQYADDFDTHLVGTLGYQGHRVLIEQLPPDAPARFAHVLDLGCGTGLCGQGIRARAGRLSGIDLSPAMVERARARGVYDTLQVADITTYLQTCDAVFDLVLAADVFIYVGALEPVFEALLPRLAPGGWLAFTIEEAASDQPPLVLGPDLRYAHALPAVEALARQHGLQVRSRLRAPLRQDQRQPVWGRYLVLQRTTTIDGSDNTDGMGR